MDLIDELAGLIKALNDAGVRYAVVSKEGLIRMKTIAGRLRDLADIESLTGADDES